MNATIVCPSCGADTPLTRIFCSKCGARLDLSGITHRDLAARGPGPLSYLFKVLRWATLLAAVALLVLVLWPASPQGQRGGNRDAETMKAKLVSLNSALQNGLSRSVEVPEREVNGYLTALVRSSAADAATRFRELGLREVNLHFAPERVVVLIVATRGPVPLTYEVTGVPALAEGKFTFRADGARFGHLPLPGPGVDFLARKAAVVFDSLASEKDLLGRLTRFRLDQGRLHAGVGEAGEPGVTEQ